MSRPDTLVPASIADGGHEVAPVPANRRGKAIVASLAITQTIGYGALYYAFAVLLVPIARDLRVSTTAVTGALTASTLAGAAMAVPVGRWLDRHGGRGLMTTGSIVGSLLLVALAHVHTLAAFYAVWMGIGLASAMVLYEAAFAVIVTWFDARRRAAALLALTVVAGFSSSIFLPLTGQLVAHHGWRTAVLILAAVHATTTIPLHAATIRRAPGPTSHHERPARAERDRRAVVHTATRDRRFWLLTAAFVANAASISALTVHLVAYLIQAGHPATFAAGVAGLLGLLSVTGRLVTTGLQRRHSTAAVVAAVFTLQALAAASLPLVGSSNIGAVAGVLCFGLGFGVASIAYPALLTQAYGTAGYATIAGLLTVPVTVARAGAPLAAATLYAATGSYAPVLLAIAGCSAIAALAISAQGRRT